MRVCGSTDPPKMIQFQIQSVGRCNHSSKARHSAELIACCRILRSILLRTPAAEACRGLRMRRSSVRLQRILRSVLPKFYLTQERRGLGPETADGRRLRTQGTGRR